MKERKADVFFAASAKEKRDQYAIMSKFIADQVWAWYVLAENKITPSVKDYKKNANLIEKKKFNSINCKILSLKKETSRSIVLKHFFKGASNIS